MRIYSYEFTQAPFKMQPDGFYGFKIGAWFWNPPIAHEYTYLKRCKIDNGAL